MGKCFQKLFISHWNGFIQCCKEKGTSSTLHWSRGPASLRDLAKTCSFETCTDKEMIRDQIVEKTTMPKIRERLLMESELTLEKTLEIARSIESAVRESKILGNAQTSHVNRVHAPSKPQQRERACYRCGSKSHLANDFSV